MSDVQLENGYTRIANELLEELAKTDINGTQRRIIDVVIRYTYGFHRKEHALSLTFISKATNIHKMQVQRELSVLINRSIITVTKEATFSKSRTLTLNKDYNNWLNSEQLTKKLTVNESDNHTVSELANRTVNELANQETKKENLKEKGKNSFDNSFEALWKQYPNKKGKQDVKASHKKEIHKIGYEKMKQAIDNYNVYIEKNKDWYKAMYGGRFFKGAYKDYLEENFQEQQEEEQKSIYPDL